MIASLVPDSVIKHYKESRSLISIKRDGINTSTIQCFVFDYKDDWILLGKIYDMTYDGLFLCKISDLSSMTCQASDAFQRGMMADEGLLDDIDFSQSFNSRDLPDYVNSIEGCKVVIVEDEKENIFMIGTDVGATLDEDGDWLIGLLSFSGAGRFDDEREDYFLEDVSSISIGTVYSLFYERYFKRNKNVEQDGAGQAPTAPESK